MPKQRQQEHGKGVAKLQEVQHRRIASIITVWMKNERPTCVFALEMQEGRGGEGADKERHEKTACFLAFRIP